MDFKPPMQNKKYVFLTKKQQHTKSKQPMQINKHTKQKQNTKHTHKKKNPWYPILTDGGWQAILADLIKQEQLEKEKQI